MFYPFENIKNSITIILSSYFHIFEAKAWHLLSYTHIFLNVFKSILKHAIIQYYAMKSKIFLLLIIKIKDIHDFNVLSLSLWILSTKKNISFIGILYHVYTHMENVVFGKDFNLGTIGSFFLCFHPKRNSCGETFVICHPFLAKSQYYV